MSSYVIGHSAAKKPFKSWLILVATSFRPLTVSCYVFVRAISEFAIALPQKELPITRCSRRRALAERKIKGRRRSSVAGALRFLSDG